MNGNEVGELVVAVLTYKRVDDIVELAPLLLDQANSLTTPARVVVVDNDPEASARDPIAALQLDGVTYVHESAAGIAHARNAALDAAGDAHLLVFIDDDERPEPNWLGALVDTYRSTRATGVAGVVAPAPGLVHDDWIERGEFFVRKRHRTGATQPAASTANLLIDLRQVQALGAPRFDLAFGMTGGSDTLFTRTLVQRGGTIVWCDESVVIDYIRAARVTRAWVLQRAFRSGNSWSRTSVALIASPAKRLATRSLLTAKGLARIGVGAARELFGRVTGNLRHQARGRRSIARGSGMALGAWGVVYNEYGKNHASRAA
jgi:succinoglycan biosynthesis protein ExoM